VRPDAVLISAMTAQERITILRKALTHISEAIGGGGNPSEKTILHWKKLADNALTETHENFRVRQIAHNRKTT
jgi:hypothetical protein